MFLSYITQLHLHVGIFFHQTLVKSSRLSEKELAEAASRWATEKTEKVEASTVPEISEYDVSKYNTNKHLYMVIYFIHSVIVVSVIS